MCTSLWLIFQEILPYFLKNRSPLRENHWSTWWPVYSQVWIWTNHLIHSIIPRQQNLTIYKDNPFLEQWTIHARCTLFLKKVGKRWCCHRVLPILRLNVFAPVHTFPCLFYDVWDARWFQYVAIIAQFLRIRRSWTSYNGYSAIWVSMKKVFDEVGQIPSKNSSKRFEIQTRPRSPKMLSWLKLNNLGWWKVLRVNPEDQKPGFSLLRPYWDYQHVIHIFGILGTKRRQ